MNNNLLPIPLLNSLKSSSLLHNIFHTSNVTLNMINNLIPVYSNIKPVIKNVKIIHKAFTNNKNVKEDNVIDSNKPTIKNNEIKKDISYIDNSISFFQ